MKFIDKIKSYFQHSEKVEFPPYLRMDEKELRRIALETQRQLTELRNLRKRVLVDISSLKSTVECQSELLGNPTSSIVDKWKAIIADLNSDFLEEERLYIQDINRLHLLKEISTKQREALAKQK